MEIIICPTCGQKMKTKALIRGTILCPACQIRFKTPEPNQTFVATTQEQSEFDGVYVTLFTIFGLFWAFLFTATGGFEFFIWNMIMFSIDGFWLLFAPLYLAQLFAALYFLTPVYTKFFGQQSSMKTPPLRHPQGALPSMQQVAPPPAQPQEPHQRTTRGMNLFAGMSIVFFLLSLLILIVVGIVFLPFILLLLGGGGFT
jgi:hypothetical protein